MPIIIREHQPRGFIPQINGVTFEPFGEGSVSTDVADAALVDNFLAVGGYRLATEADELPEHLVVKPKAAEPKETAAQKKAREKAEKEAAAAAEAEAAAVAAAAAAEAEAKAKAKADAEAEAKAKTDAEITTDSDEDGDKGEVF